MSPKRCKEDLEFASNFDVNLTKLGSIYFRKVECLNQFHFETSSRPTAKAGLRKGVVRVLPVPFYYFPYLVSPWIAYRMNSLAPPGLPCMSTYAVVP
jgi:hypothetical protein